MFSNHARMGNSTLLLVVDKGDSGPQPLFLEWGSLVKMCCARRLSRDHGRFGPIACKRSRLTFAAGAGAGAMAGHSFTHFVCLVFGRGDGAGLSACREGISSRQSSCL